MSRPVYSNIAYQVLFYALEAETGKNFTQLLQELITTPFNMTSTIPSPGNDSLAVIPPVSNNWGSPYGDAVPAGGLVSTLADLSSFLSAILHRTILDTPTETTQWLQPISFAGSQHSFLGAPWEIFRPPPELLFPGNPDDSPTVTILAKDGGAYGYRSRIAVIDEYGLGIALLTAGDLGALAELYDAILSVVVPAAHAAAREQVETEYVGQFSAGLSAPDENGVAVPVSLATELDGKALRVAGLQRNGTDMMAAVEEVWAVTVGMFASSYKPTGIWRVYPAGVERESVLEDGTRVVEEDWRVWWDLEPDSATELPGKGISAMDCLSWTLADWLYYGSEPVDRVVFVRDAGTGRVIGADVPFMRSGFMEKGGNGDS